MRKKVLSVMVELVGIVLLLLGLTMISRAADPRWVGRIESGLARSTETMSGDIYVYKSTTDANPNFSIEYGSITRVMNITTTGDLVVSSNTYISTGTVSGYLLITGYGVTQGTFTVEDNIYLSSGYFSGLCDIDNTLSVNNIASLSTFTVSGYGVIFGTFNVKNDVNFENNVIIGNNSADETTFNSSMWFIPNSAYIGRVGETVSLTIKNNEVGINTDNPSFTLDVDGTQRISFN